MNNILVLSHLESMSKLKRMAYQIYEKNYYENSIIFIGLETRGYYIAGIICSFLEEICSKRIACIPYDRSNPWIKFPELINNYNNPIFIVADDVLYTGGTLFDTVKNIRNLTDRPIQVAVLIDRGNRELPIYAQFVGHEMVTTLQEYVMVTITDQQAEVTEHHDEQINYSKLDNVCKIEAFLTDKKNNIAT